MQRFSRLLLESSYIAPIAVMLFSLLALVLPGADIVVAIILGYVTMSKGAAKGAILLAWIALPALAQIILAQLSIEQILFARCLVVWLAGVVLYQSRSWISVGNLIAILAFVGVLLFYRFVPHAGIWWHSQLQAMFQTEGMQHFISTAEYKTVFRVLAYFVTGFAAIGISLGIVTELLIARWWQSHIFFPVEFTNEVMNIRANGTALILAIVAIICFISGVDFLCDAAMPLFFPLMLSGWSLAHGILRYKVSSVAGLWLFYIFLFIIPVFAGFILAVLSILDYCYDFRHRFTVDNVN